MTTIAEAIKSLSPNAKFQVIENDINQIDWQSPDIEQPSNQSIENKIIELQSEFDSLSWFRSRVDEYPDLQSCIHALLDGGKTLEDLQKIRADIKDKFPKPK